MSLMTKKSAKIKTHSSCNWASACERCFMFSKNKRNKHTLILSVLLFFSASIVGTYLQGCQSNQSSDASSSPKVLGIFPPAPPRSGAQLWADNCTRCHNAPPPERFSDAQWDVIVHHMRVRANLTGEEQRKITEFLQASN